MYYFILLFYRLLLYCLLLYCDAYVALAQTFPSVLINSISSEVRVHGPDHGLRKEKCVLVSLTFNVNTGFKEAFYSVNDT